MPYTKPMNNVIRSTQLTPGTILTLSGVKAPVVVVSVEGWNVTVNGPRGEFLLNDCGSHWVRWPLPSGPFARSASPRECTIEYVIPCVAVA